ncbi:MAG: ATP-binding protein [Spirochaetes bacterium]|nr:ATP-binding protein [Spirochaetota bacterium]
MSVNDRIHLLLVMNDKAIAANLANDFERRNFHVTIAHKSEEALSFCDSDPSIDLVLMDTCAESIEAARVIIDRDNTPLLFLSDHADDETIRVTDELNAFGTVSINQETSFIASSVKTAIRLHESIKEQRLRLMFLEAVANSSADGILVVDLKGQKILQNNRTVELWKIPSEVVSDPNGSRQVAHVMSMTKNPKQFIDEIEIQRKNPMQINIDQLELVDGTVLHRHSSPVPGPDGRNYGRIYHFHDVTSFKRAEDEIRGLLAEKELILKEAHHRVRNYMNTLIALLSLQASSLKEPSAIEALKEAQNRIHSMVLLYDKLYVSENFNSMSIAGYLPVLIDEIISNFPKSYEVTVEKHIDDFIIDAKILQVIGIITNEIITNIMKYAFTDQQNGKITVSISRENNRVTLCIEDNGVGMAEEVSSGPSSGFGLRLVNMLAVQLKGNIRIDRRQGTVFTLDFNI